MPFLLDSGILLRLVDERDPQHKPVRAAVETLGNERAELYITTQNIAEFWNVASRPVANNGLALSPAVIAKLFEDAIEPICGVVTETDALIDVFRRLLAQYGVVGKQVHDARLVAMMLTWHIDRILTLNDRNFRRYEPEGIRVETAASVLSAR